MVICSTWLLGSGTLPTRMSRVLSMRRLVSMTSIESPSGGELIQGDVVLDVFGNQGAVLLRYGAKIAGGEDRVGGQIGELTALDEMAYLVAGDVGLEEGLDGRDGLGLLGLGIGDELGELLFQQFVLRLEARDQAEDLFEDFAQGQAAVHGGGFAQLVEGVILLGFVEDLAVHVVDDAIPLPGLDGCGDGLVLAHGVLEFLEEHAVDLHALVADGLFPDRGNDILAQVLVGAADHYRSCAAAVIAALALGPRELQHLVVVELLLEVFAIGEEVEQLEGGLLRLQDAIFEAVVEELFEEVVLTGAAPLDLDEVGRGKDGAEEAEIEDVGAIVAGGHHANRHADARLAGLVSGQEVGRTEQVVVGEVDAELLGVGDLRGDLHGEIGLVLAGEHAVGHLIEDLSQLGGVILADSEDDGLADLAADRIAQGIFQKGLAEQLVRGVGEEALLELALLEGLLLVFAGIVGERDDEALFGKQFGGDLGAGIHHRGIDQVAFLDAVQQ